jgi:hypothetical protein
MMAILCTALIAGGVKLVQLHPSQPGTEDSEIPVKRASWNTCPSGTIKSVAEPLGPFEFHEITSENGISGSHYNVALNLR